MNILPKKKWHVRTKENIERVRRDEAQAAEEERERERRQRLAEQEARTSLLRSKARSKLGVTEVEKEEEESSKDLGFEGGGDVESLTGSTGHVNFFKNLEDGEKLAKGNEEHETEKKKEQEEYEKKIGYLTYLGQDTEELTGDKVWWRKLPERGEASDNKEKSDFSNKQKLFLDPIRDVKKHLGCEYENLSLKKHVKKSETAVVSLKRKRSSSPELKKKKKEKKRKEKKSKYSHSKKKSSGKKTKKRKYSTSSSSSGSSDSDEEDKRRQKQTLDRLRKERLERERKEREKANLLLYGEPKKKKTEPETAPTLKQTYNSQFNPEIARQNKLDPKQKYWLE